MVQYNFGYQVASARLDQLDHCGITNITHYGCRRKLMSSAEPSLGVRDRCGRTQDLALREASHLDTKYFFLNKKKKA